MAFRILNFEFEISGPPSLSSGSRGENPKSEIRNPKSAEAGYTLVIFVMVIAVMAIMMAVAVEIISFQMRREREAELIFRGQQYVEAIRLYKQKYGRNPMRLQELWEANPKVLRRNWKDPITDSEEWGLVFLGQEGRELGGPGGPAGLGGAGGPTGSDERRRTGSDEPRSNSPLGDSPLPGDTDGSEESGPGGGGERVGPIVGVHSRSTDAAIKIYEGRTQYNEWKFVLKETGQQDAGGGAQPPADDGTPWGQPPTPVRPGGGQPGGGQPGGGTGGGSQPPGQPPGRYPTPPRPQPTGTPWG